MIQKVISTFLVCDQKIAGCGGFINITQTSPVVVYCGTFTAKGLKETIGNGKLTIDQEGHIKKFKTILNRLLSQPIMRMKQVKKSYISLSVPYLS